MCRLRVAGDSKRSSLASVFFLTDSSSSSAYLETYICNGLTAQIDEVTWVHSAGGATLNILTLPECFWEAAPRIKKLTLSSIGPGAIVFRGSTASGAQSDPLLGLSTQLEFLSLKSVRLLDPITHNGVDGFTANLESFFQARVALQDVEISNSQLQGSLPSDLSPNVALRRIYMADNQLTGPLPVTYSSEMRTFNVANNRLSGPLPAAVPTKIQTFSITNNAISGSIPPTFLHRLEYDHPGFYMSQNSLTGSLPQYLFNTLDQTIQRSIVFQVSHNRISGTIPFNFLTNSAALIRMSQFQLTFTNNTIEGTIPSDLLSLSFSAHTISLSFAENRLSGSIPLLFNGMSGALSKIELNLAFNQLTGQVPVLFPDGVGVDMLNEFHFNFSSNLLVGPLPTHLVPSTDALPSLRSVYWYLDSNTITGTIPSTLLSRFFSPFTITSVDLSNNLLTGALPSDLFEMMGENNLGTQVVLRVASNRLTGPLAPLSMPFVNDLRLDLASNNITGTIPTGFIPSLLDARVRTVNLNLSKNAVTGALTLPTSTSIYSSLLLNLRRNSLESYSVASSVPYLKALDVGENYDMTGTIPTAFFQNASTLSVFIANHTKISGDFPYISYRLNSALGTLDLSSTGINFCGPNREAWNVFGIICKLYNTSATDCSQLYPSQCQFVEPAPVSPPASPISPPSNTPTPTSAPVTTPSPVPPTPSPVTNPTPSSVTPTPSMTTPTTSPIPNDAPTSSTPTPTENPSTPSEVPSSSPLEPSSIPVTTFPPNPILLVPGNPPTPTSAASKILAGFIFIALSAALSAFVF